MIVIKRRDSDTCNHQSMHVGALLLLITAGEGYVVDALRQGNAVYVPCPTCNKIVLSAENAA